MYVHEYQGYGNNKTGLHWTPVTGHTHSDLTWAINKCQEMKLGWVTLVDDGGGSILQTNPYYGKSVARMFQDRGIEVVARLFASSNAKFDARMKDTVQNMVDNGVLWVFYQNEPEVGGEEYPNRPEDWVREVTRLYVDFAYQVMELGGYPGSWATTTFHFPDENGNIVNPFKEYMTAAERDDIFKNGSGWIPIHPYPKNHPIDYPYDDVNQYGTHMTHEEYEYWLNQVDQGYRECTGDLWVFDDYQIDEHHINFVRDNGINTGDTIDNDDVCWWMYKGINGYLDDLELLPYVPLIATEAGPVVGDRDDGRYPKVTPQQQIVMIESEMDDIAHVDNFLGVCYWLAGVQRLDAATADGFEDQSWWTDRHNDPFALEGEMPIVEYLTRNDVGKVNMNKLGMHIQIGDNGLLPYLADIDAPVNKTMDLSPSWCASLRDSTNGLIVGRAWVDDQDRYKTDPQGLIDEMIDKYAPAIEYLDVVEVPNEVPNNHTCAEDIIAFDQFQYDFAQAVWARWPNVKVGLFQIATGNFSWPESDEPQLSDFPLSMELPTDKVYICLHAYSWPSMQVSPEAYTLRYRYIMEGYPNHKVIITECGVTNAVVVNEPDVGWRTHGNRVSFIDDLVWYNERLNADPNVVGATVFTCGPSWGWDTFESADEVLDAVAVIKSEEEPEPEPEPEPDPTPDPDPEPDTINLATDYNVTVESPSGVGVGEPYFKVIKVTHLGPCENKGGHNVFVDVLDESGQRMIGAVVSGYSVELENEKTTTIDKTGLYGGDIPLWKNDNVLLEVDSSLKSEWVSGLSSDWEDTYCEEDGELGNSKYHHSFSVIWQLVIKSDSSTPDPDSGITEDDIRNTAWMHAGVDFNPEAAFYKYAQEVGLGNPLPGNAGQEFDWEGYRIQCYSGGIVYAPIDRWGETTHISW